jgi:hypothetical protein
MDEKATLNKKMREGECRTTKKGQKFCKRGGKVRFVKH